MVFEKWILRRIFGTNRIENGEGRRFHSEELRSLYRSGIPTGRRPLGSPSSRWEDNVRMDLKRDVIVRIWMNSAQSRDY